MTRRSKPYLVELSVQTFKLSASEWDELLAGGWTRPIPDRVKTARLASGVAGWIRGCDLYLLDLVALARIRSVSVSWAHAWLYHVGVLRAAVVGEAYFERQDRVMRELDRDLQNEALIWRTFRDKRTKGANSLVWIPSEHKIEILRALRPEGVLGIESISRG
jgi:ATP/maltotriose-dependent transcriptional regulator MalT